MITRQEFQTLKEYKPLENAIENLKAVTAKHNVTCTIDLEQIKSEFKAQLFAQLLNVDKGLKARYNLMRTDKAKADLLNQEILSLEGYDEIDEIQSAINQYQESFAGANNVIYESLQFTNSKEFLEVFEGNLDKAFEGRIITIEDTPIFKQLEIIRDAVIELKELGYFTIYNYSQQTVFRKLEKHIKQPWSNYETGKPEIDVKRLATGMS